MQGEDLSYEAWVASRKKSKQSSGAPNASRSHSKPAGKKSEPQKGAQTKMVLIAERGSAIGVTAVEVDIISYPIAP